MEKRRQMAEDTNKTLDRADAEYYDLEDKYNELKAQRTRLTIRRQKKLLRMLRMKPRLLRPSRRA